MSDPGNEVVKSSQVYKRIYEIHIFEFRAAVFQRLENAIHKQWVNHYPLDKYQSLSSYPVLSIPWITGARCETISAAKDHCKFGSCKNNKSNQGKNAWKCRLKLDMSPYDYELVQHWRVAFSYQAHYELAICMLILYSVHSRLQEMFKFPNHDEVLKHIGHLINLRGPLPFSQDHRIPLHW